MYLFILNLLLLSLINPISKSPKDFVWENRILIIQSNEFEFDWFDKSLDKELKERKLLVFQFEGKVLLKSNCKDEIDPIKFLEKLEIRKSHTNSWALIGLDGGIKNSGNKAPRPSEIFKIIDAMPMRQSEIRKSNIY